jgi:hypothetical protein
MADSFEGDVRNAIGRAYPQFSEEELSSAVEAFLGYIKVVNDIYDRLSDDPERSAAVASLTACLPQVTVEVGQGRASQPQIAPT